MTSCSTPNAFTVGDIEEYFVSFMEERQERLGFDACKASWSEKCVLIRLDDGIKLTAHEVEIWDFTDPSTYDREPPNLVGCFWAIKGLNRDEWYYEDSSLPVTLSNYLSAMGRRLDMETLEALPCIWGFIPETQGPENLGGNNVVHLADRTGDDPQSASALAKIWAFVCLLFAR